MSVGNPHSFSNYHAYYPHVKAVAKGFAKEDKQRQLLNQVKQCGQPALTYFLRLCHTNGNLHHAVEVLKAARLCDMKFVKDNELSVYRVYGLCNGRWCCCSYSDMSSTSHNTLHGHGIWQGPM